MIRFCIKEKREESRCEDYKSERFNYGKSNFEQMRRYFGEADWSTLITASNVQKKWEAFINIYEEGVKRYVPKVETKRRYNNDWYNRRCEIASEEREMAWNRWRRKNTQELWQNYTTTRNEYVRVIREERKNYEKDVMDKCRGTKTILQICEQQNEK